MQGALKQRDCYKAIQYVFTYSDTADCFTYSESAEWPAGNGLMSPIGRAPGQGGTVKLNPAVENPEKASGKEGGKGKCKC